MRKMILIITILLFSLKVFAPQERVIYIPEAPVINPYEDIWRAVCTIESNHDPYAVGDLNFKEYSYGVAQIRRSRLLDYYQQTGIWYDVTDMFSIEKSKAVFMHYASQIDYRDTERISREWNGGKRGMNKRSTVKYWNMIRAKL